MLEVVHDLEGPSLLHLPPPLSLSQPQGPYPREPVSSAHLQAEQTAASWGPHSFDLIL